MYSLTSHRNRKEMKSKRYRSGVQRRRFLCRLLKVKVILDRKGMGEEFARRYRPAEKKMYVPRIGDGRRKFSGKSNK